MKKLIPIFFLLLSIHSKAQTIAPDFNPFIKSNVEIRVLAVQKDDKVIIAGNFITVDTSFARGLARINPDGTLDSTFKFNYKVSNIYSITCLPDGKILIAGDNINPDLKDIVRLNSDGSIDNSFNTTSNIRSILRAEIQSDGKYIIFNTWEGSLIRLNEDGSIDESFTTNNEPLDCYGQDFFDLKVLPDDKILLSGCFKTFNGQSHPGLVRLNSDGFIDESFNIGTGLTDISSTISSIGLQSDNKIVCVGKFDSFNGKTVKNIIRLNPDGSIDSTFTTPGPSANVYSDQIRDILVLKNDKIVLIGSDLENNTWFYKTMILTSNGNFDNSFSMSVMRFALTPDVVEVHNPVLGINSEKKIIIGGNFDLIKNEKRIGLASVDSLGIITGFNAKLGSEPIINAIKVQKNGQIVIAGSFMEVNGVSVKNYARLNTDGSIDSTFTNNSGSGPDREILVIEIQDDGKILLGGAFDLFNDDYNKAKLVQLNSDGTLDSTFSSLIGSNYVGFGINLINIQNNGKIIIAGSFTYVNNIYKNNLARLNKDGTIDLSFNPNNIFNYQDIVYTLDYQSDSSFIIGGATWGGSGFMLRTDSLAVIDNTFNLDFSLFYTNIQTLKVLNNDNIIFGGSFAQLYPDEPKPIYQVDKDGNTIDSISLSIKDGWLKRIYKFNDSTLFIIGSFKKVNDVDQPGFAKLSLIDGNFTYNIFDQDFINSINTIDSINNSIIFIGGRYSMIGGQGKSDKFDNTSISKLWLENGMPKILSINSVDCIYEDTYLYIPLDSLVISDSDYPSYNISIPNGLNYSVRNDTIFPDKDFCGTLIIPISLRDKNNYSLSYNYYLKVLPVNDPPKTNSDSYNADESDTLLITKEFGLLANDYDIDGDDLMAIKISDPLFGLLNLNSDGSFTYINSGLEIYTDSFTYKVNDGLINGDTVKVTLKINPINDIPEIKGVISPITTYKNTSTKIELNNLIVVDPDNSYPDDFTLLIYNESNYSFSGNTITPSNNYIGILNIPVSVNDGTINSNNYNVTVEVILSTGIDNSILNQNLSIFPIPFDENLTIEYKNTSEKFIINIIDSESKLVYSKYYQGFKDSNKIYINTSIFKKGLYILELIDGDEIIHRKIIK